LVDIRPTPVSALIHAATMVTAGVYLLLRCSPILEYSTTTLVVVTFIGALTAFIAATIGLLQNDLKRVIAYSTCSQLGYSLKQNIVINKMFSSPSRRAPEDNNEFTFNDLLKVENPSDFIKNIIPVKIFTDLSPINRFNIKTQFRNIPCIYLWYNTINGRTYVGKTINTWDLINIFLQNI
jgi:hypothetical protein